MLIQDYLINSAGLFPEKEAVITMHSRSTYGEIHRDASRIAAWLLDNSLSAGDRVAILMDEPVDYVKSYFGILLAGGTVVALNTQPSARSLRYQLNNCEVSFLLTQSRFMKFVACISGNVDSLQQVIVSRLDKGEKGVDLSFPIVSFETILAAPFEEKIKFPEVSSDSLAQIIYTSGTTGDPNGVMLMHSNLVANTTSIVEYLKLTEDDRVMAVLPFFYSYGNSLLLTHFSVGASLVVNQHFLYPNVILDQMKNEEVTGFSGVPSTFAILLNRSSIHDYKFPCLRYITQAGDAMSPKLAHAIKDMLPHVDVYIMYGQTEASARLSYLAPSELFRKAGSIGKAIPGVTLTLMDRTGNPVAPGEVGEIVANGDNIMAGYWKDAEKTTQVLKKTGLWTGELARMDEEGFFYIVSRKSEMIKSGAHRISPKEIEEVILENHSVHEVAVIGVSDELLGEKIRACIVLKDGSDLTRMDLLKHCKALLPMYKVPHEVDLLHELPKTSSGKVRKKELQVR